MTFPNKVEEQKSNITYSWSNCDNVVVIICHLIFSVVSDSRLNQISRV